MEQCVTIPLIAMQFLVYLITCGIITMEDLSEIKKPFDTEKKAFSWRKDWWKYRWDDIAKKLFWGTLGAVLAKEVGHRMVTQFLDWGEIAETSIELTAVFACTYFISKLWGKDRD